VAGATIISSNSEKSLKGCNFILTEERPSKEMFEIASKYSVPIVITEYIIHSLIAGELLYFNKSWTYNYDSINDSNYDSINESSDNENDSENIKNTIYNSIKDKLMKEVKKEIKWNSKPLMKENGKKY